MIKTADKNSTSIRNGNNSSCIHREAFVFVRSSNSEKFLFVVGGECYFNVGSAFFFFLDEHGECFGVVEVFLFLFLFFDRTFFFSIGMWVDN